LAIWLYENQGALRFGADNRFYIVVLDTEDRSNSWKLKRNFDLLKRSVYGFLSSESVGPRDEVVFRFGTNVYTALTKVLLVTNQPAGGNGPKQEEEIRA